jgi:uncharacterized membrane protein
MGVATYATRLAGDLLRHRLSLGKRADAALEALPPAILTAVIAPVALATGPAETLAAAMTGLAALRLPLIAAVGIGVASVVALRALFGAAWIA